MGPDLDFYADLLTKGTVLGVDHTSTLPEVEAVLGHGRTWPILQSSPDSMITHTGLVEFGWHQGESGWANWPAGEPACGQLAPTAQNCRCFMAELKSGVPPRPGTPALLIS